MRKTYLGSNLEHVLERHTGICQLALQEHDHIVIVFLQLLALRRLGALRFTLFDVRL